MKFAKFWVRLLIDQAQAKAMLPQYRGGTPKKRSRIPGPVNPAGSKIARKAFDSRLTLRG